MKFKNFSIHASPFFADAQCACGDSLRQVSNGLISVALFCRKCGNVYEPKLVKVPDKKISKQWLEQAYEETA